MQSGALLASCYCWFRSKRRFKISHQSSTLFQQVSFEVLTAVGSFSIVQTVRRLINLHALASLLHACNAFLQVFSVATLTGAHRRPHGCCAVFSAASIAVSGREAQVRNKSVSIRANRQGEKAMEAVRESQRSGVRALKGKSRRKLLSCRQVFSPTLTSKWKENGLSAYFALCCLTFINYNWPSKKEIMFCS